jgi:RHS repeat-associated protein
VPYGPQGMRTDTLVGTVIADNRVDGPALMRWLQTDLIGLNDGNNYYEYEGNGPIDAFDPSGLNWWTRLVGGLQYIGGVAETLVGGALVIAPEPVLTKVGGVLIAAHGIDNALAGWNQMVTGQVTQSYTSQGLTKYHEWTGENHNGAVQLAELENAYISMVCTAGGSYVLSNLPPQIPKGSGLPGQWDSGNYPRPPGYNNTWRWGPASGEGSAGWRWWDPNGGEWRWHAPDPWHPTGHWDWNPWEVWNSPWENVWVVDAE